MVTPFFSLRVDPEDNPSFVEFIRRRSMLRLFFETTKITNSDGGAKRELSLLLVPKTNPPKARRAWGPGATRHTRARPIAIPLNTLLNQSPTHTQQIFRESMDTLRASMNALSHLHNHNLPSSCCPQQRKPGKGARPNLLSYRSWCSKRLPRLHLLQKLLPKKTVVLAGVRQLTKEWARQQKTPTRYVRT